MNEETKTWICLKCSHEVEWDYSNLVDKGEPVCPECDSNMIVKVDINELVDKLRSNLIDDILDRYNNSDYWDPAHIEHFINEHELNTKQRKDLLKKLES